MRPVDGVLMSAIGANNESDVTYIPNEWAVRQPNCGPLCVFDDLPSARQFNHHIMRVPGEIWECEIERSRSKTVWLIFRGRRVAEFRRHLPYRAVLALRVKLTKQVES